MFEISKNLKLEKTNEVIAQNFWDESFEASFFTNPNFLKKFKEKIEYWIVKKGDEQLCLWPICKNKNQITSTPIFSYYFGPYWSKFLEKKISHHSKFSLSMQVYELFIKKFKKKYKNIYFNFPPSNHDVRYFVWKKNFNKNDKIIIIPKYSAIISKLNKKKMSDIYAGFSKLRRRMINKAKKNKNIQKTNYFKLYEIIDLYKKTILRKNKLIDKNILKKNISKIEILFSIHEKDKTLVSLNGFRDKKSKELISLIMLGNSKNTSNLILNLSNIEYQKTGVTALALYEAIKYSKKIKNSNFDFNGSNSFIGSDDKHSYGSNYRLYFEIKSETKKERT